MCLIKKNPGTKIYFYHSSIVTDETKKERELYIKWENGKNIKAVLQIKSHYSRKKFLFKTIKGFYNKVSLV